MHNNDSVVSADQDCKIRKSAPSVTYVFKKGKSFGNSLFSGGMQGSDQITVKIHDSIFHGLTFCTSGSLTLDITIAPYKITPFFFIFYILLYRYTHG